MKNKSSIIALAISLVLVLGIASGALAQAPGDLIDPLGTELSTGEFTTIGGVVGVLIIVVKWVYTILFIVAVLFILLAAFNFITSKGDAEKVGTAKKQLLYAVVGIAVGLLAYAIVELVRGSLGSGGM